jgi:C-terminal processing protease CtpA/Prc
MKHKTVIYLFLVLFITVSGIQCGKEKVPVTDSKNTLKSFFDFLDKEYMNPGKTEGPSYDKVILIKKAVSQEKALSDLTNAGEDAVADRISSLPAAEQPAVLLHVLRIMAESLPFGSNAVIGAESNKLMNDTTHNAGIGLVIRREGPGRFIVIDSLEGSPSQRENIPTGHFLSKIDGSPTDKMYDLEEVVGRIRGKAGTKVSVEINGKEYTLNREAVVFQNILSSHWKSGNGKKHEYILLRSSLAGSADQLKNLIMGLDGRESIIIDLRKMQSGDYSESFRIADLFTDSGNLGYLFTKDKGDQNFPADANRFHTGKLYVILGKNPTPFAEIISMALKGKPNITILSPNTDSTGAFIAKSFSLPGQHELRLTAGYIKNPAGKPLYENPVTPDVLIQDSLASKPPLDKPDPSDSAQKELGQILNIF